MLGYGGQERAWRWRPWQGRRRRSTPPHSHPAAQSPSPSAPGTTPRPVLYSSLVFHRELPTIGWFSDVSDSAILLLQLLDLLKGQGRKLSYVLGHWFGHSLWPLMPRNSARSPTQSNLLQVYCLSENLLVVVRATAIMALGTQA